MTELERIFERANRAFISDNSMLFVSQVSERTLCGALMIKIHEILKHTRFASYYVDVEYNRNYNGKVKTIKRIKEDCNECIVTINCDLIVHSRGENSEKDNLIALEMKKSTRRRKDKISDRLRLECLTKNTDH